MKTITATSRLYVTQTDILSCSDNYIIVKLDNSNQNANLNY